MLPRDIDYHDTSQYLDLGSGVGRGSLRDERLKAIVNVNPISKIVTEHHLQVSDEAPRFRGLLAVIQKAFSQLDLGDKPIVLQSTVLNLAQAINRVASGGELKVQAWGSDWRKLSNLISDRVATKGLMLMTNYSPHRVEPDRRTTTRTGKKRLDAVRMGSYHLYPCHFVEYRDALEVRFGSDSVSAHEIWLDYGPSESTAYVRNAVALGATQRLAPAVLVQVDPQAFWSAVLHCDAFVATLKECCAGSSSSECKLDEWLALGRGRTKSIASIRSIEEMSETKLLPDKNGRWQLENEAHHDQLSLRNAQAAICTVKLNDESLYDPHSEIDYKIEILDYYRGTQIEKDINAVMNAQFAGDPEDLTRIFTLLCMGISSDSLEVCGKCGTTDRLSLCSRCQCVCYCSKACQKAAFKSHKKVCGQIAGDSSLKCRIYRARSSIPTKAGVFVETSGVGFLNVFWSGKEGGDNTISFKEDLQMGVTERVSEVRRSDGNTINFRFFRDLDPVWRLALTCGPLPSLDIAKASIDDALRTVGGDASRLRLPFVGFSPLELAAKKGNKAIVDWLCEDSRTKSLVKTGSPIGWAMYTGRLDIARTLKSHGADHVATDAVLWNFKPPLLVAASNGQVEAMQFLVGECGQDIGTLDRDRRGVLAIIEDIYQWNAQEGHSKAHKWAKKKLKSKK